MTKIINIIKEGNLYEYDEVVTIKRQVNKKDLLAERIRLQSRISEIDKILEEIKKIEEKNDMV